MKMSIQTLDWMIKTLKDATAQWDAGKSKMGVVLVTEEIEKIRDGIELTIKTS